MSKSNENNPYLASVSVGTQTATITLPVAYFRKKSILKKVSFLDQAGIVASNTNYVTMQLKNGSTVLAEYDTRAANEGALTANVAGHFPETEIEVAADSSLVLLITVGGTVTTTKAILQLEGYKI